MRPGSPPLPTIARAVALALALTAGGPAACTSPAEPAPEQAAAPVKVEEPATPTPTPPKARAATAPAHGFGSKIAWRGLTEGLREASDEHKPVMLVVHASWCPKCKDLKPTFFDPAVVAASDHLVMVNVDQDEEPQSVLYGPDGTYVPRVLFLDPAGQVDRQLQNSARDRFHYFYTPADDLVGMMKQAIARHGQKS